jgi:hypothetical protein
MQRHRPCCCTRVAGLEKRGQTRMNRASCLNTAVVRGNEVGVCPMSLASHCSGKLLAFGHPTIRYDINGELMSRGIQQSTPEEGRECSNTGACGAS